jgi:hypothetical protein
MMIRPDLMSNQYAPTLRAELPTQPAVFDSGPIPLGYEAAPPPQQCRGWCERQGRECGRCAEDSRPAALAIAQLQAERQRVPNGLAVAVCIVAAVAAVALILHRVMS